MNNTQNVTTSLRNMKFTNLSYNHQRCYKRTSSTVERGNQVHNNWIIYPTYGIYCQTKEAKEHHGKTVKTPDLPHLFKKFHHSRTLNSQILTYNFPPLGLVAESNATPLALIVLKSPLSSSLCHSTC